MLELVLSRRYLNGLFRRKDKLIMYTHLEEPRKKWPKNDQKNLKLSTIGVFCLLVNK